MDILLLGGGGREHALAWKIQQSPLCARLIAAPGNGGIAEIADCVALDIENGAAVVGFCRKEGIDFVVIGPEAPLAAGVADALREAGIACFGPSRAAARLESSKTFAHEICDACGAPAADWAVFTDVESAKAHLRETGAPIVVKADGLAAGKGVVVADTLDQALEAVDAMFSGDLPGAISDASSGEDDVARVVIERMMAGEEASLFALTDGETVLTLASCQDHKRAYDGDKGPNTGGMGAYSPAPVMTAEVERLAVERIVKPAVAEMKRRGTPYQGVLYAGLMIENGEPRLVEFNARFGDPEAQILMMRLESDILPALIATAEGGLDRISLDWSADPAMTVVIAAKGYPGDYAKGEPIEGFDQARAITGVEVFHAGTRREGERVRSNGGRVLNVSAAGATLEQARDRAYRAVDAIDWPGGFHRRDIGWRALSKS